MAIDRVTLQILADHCAAATESMAHTLLRTAHSTFVKETEDFTTGLATADGKTFASPYDLGATWFVGLDYGRAIDLVDGYEEGDLCITNDPYSGFVCTHSPDVHLWKPIFHEGELVCFSVGHVHNTDVGGAVPASLSRANTEVHQEGIRFPPVEALPARRAQSRAGRRDAHERAHARAELGRSQGPDRGDGHGRAQGPRDDRAIRHRHLPGRRSGPARLRRSAGEAPHRAHPRRGVLLRRLHGRGRRRRQALPHRGEHGHGRRRGDLRLLRDRSSAHLLAEHPHWRRPPPRAADDPLHLRDVHHGPLRAAELGAAASRALHHPGRVAGESEVPGGGRHAQPGRDPGCSRACSAPSRRRCPTSCPRPAATAARSSTCAPPTRAPAGA